MLIRTISKYVKKVITTYGNKIVSLALFLSVGFSIGSCRFILHQPEEPKELERYIKKMKGNNPFC